MTWVGVGFAAAFWLLESLLHAFVFDDQPLVAALKAGGDANELWMRAIISLLFVAFGWGAARAVEAERRLTAGAGRLARLLQFTDYMRSHALRAPKDGPLAGPLPLDLAVSQDDLGRLTRMIWDLSDFLDGRFRELRALLDLTRQINMGWLLDEVLAKAYATLRSVLPYDRLGLALIDDDGRTVRARWAASSAPRMLLARGYAAPLQGSSLQAVMSSGEPRILNDLQAYLKTHPQSDSTRLIVEEGIRSSLTCPLVSGGKPIGFLFFSSRAPGTYKHVHVEMFRLIAGHLSVVVEKSDLYQQLLHEKENSESLLLNVIPQRIAARLRAGEHPIAESFPVMNVLFADIVDFTEFAGRHPPEQVLRTLQDVFLILDHLCDLYGVEKIKTIGDEYMAVSGQAHPGPQALCNLAEFALDAQASIGKLRYPDGSPIGMRIGLHTGSVVAGVIGQKKFAYDMWGDAVNIASRMQSHGEAGRIHVSADAYAQLSDRFAFEERGVIEVKGKGAMKTYFLLGKK